MIFKLLVAEIAHRKVNFVLMLSAIVAAATLFVAAPALIDGYRRDTGARILAQEQAIATRLAAMGQETQLTLASMQSQADKELADINKSTRRIMRDLGFNLRIVHKNTDLTKLYAEFVAFDMPEEYVTRLAGAPEITKIVHLVATLKQMIELEGKSRLLVGFAPEATQSHVEQKAPMGFNIQPGTVFLGSEAGKGLKVGESIDVLGETFEIARILPAHGNEEDIVVALHLKDAQRLLGTEGKISEIVALGCKCETIERVEEIREQLQGVLPEANVTEYKIIADAREKQRQLLETYHAKAMNEYRAGREALAAAEEERLTALLGEMKSSRGDVEKMLEGLAAVTTPLVVFLCALQVALLAWSNVRERRAEIGLLRALGRTSQNVAAIFLGKAVLLGLLGGALGALCGLLLARWLALSAMQVAAENFTPHLLLLAGTVLGAPLIAALASYLPTLVAVNQDPSIVLMDE